MTAAAHPTAPTATIASSGKNTSLLESVTAAPTNDFSVSAARAGSTPSPINAADNAFANSMAGPITSRFAFEATAATTRRGAISLAV